MAQKIWRTRVKDCKQLIHQKKAKTPSSTTTTMETIQPTQTNREQQNDSLSFDLFHPSMRSIIHQRLVNISQRAAELINFASRIEDSKLFR